MNYRLKILFPFAWTEIQAKAKKSSKFIFIHFNYPYKRQGDLHSTVVGDSWVINPEDYHKSYGIHSDCWRKPEIFCKVKINCRT